MLHAAGQGGSLSHCSHMLWPRSQPGRSVYAQQSGDVRGFTLKVARSDMLWQWLQPGRCCWRPAERQRECVQGGCTLK